MDEEGAGASTQGMGQDLSVVERLPFLSNVSSTAEIEQYMRDIAKMYAAAQLREVSGEDVEVSTEVSDIIPQTPLNILEDSQYQDAQVVTQTGQQIRQPELFESPVRITSVTRVQTDLQNAPTTPPKVKFATYEGRRGIRKRKLVDNHPPPLPPRGRSATRKTTPPPPLPPRHRSVHKVKYCNRSASPDHVNVYDFSQLADSSEEENGMLNAGSVSAPPVPPRKRRRV
ncbi:MAG: hypothetical protein GY702_00610, partial [Desulfobulbaceae bacterium]|nr:hypothetical protein [Desulfobulbaceae bacterium]